MLKFAKGLELPTSAVTQTFAFLGKRGGGKTYGAMKLTEEMLLIGAQIVAFDVVGKWYGLRIPKDDRHKPFDIVIFGGLHADIEINPKAGKIVAGIVMQKNLSVVLDLSQFIFSEQVRFMYDFLVEAFEYRKAHPAACHFIFEEAQEIVPENLPAKSQGENYAARLLSIANRVIKLGRNFGIGNTLIAQRPQEVNKKVLNMAEVLLAFQMVGLQEKDTIHKWTRSKGDETDVKDILPKLEEGHALIFSPTWLKIAGTYKISEKITADVSATPQVGVDFTQAQKLEPRDVSELSESIRALTVEMEANTPAALKKRIADLERDLKKAQTDIPKAVAAVATKEVIVEKEVPIVPAKEIDSLTKAIDRFRSEYTEKLERIAKGFEALNGQKTIDQILGAAEKIVSVAKIPQPAVTPTERVPVVNKPIARAPQSLHDRPVSHASVEVEGLKKAERLILQAFYWTKDDNSVTPAKLGFYAGYTPGAGAFNNALGGLRSKGLVAGLTLTDTGEKLASTYADPKPGGIELREWLRPKLNKAANEILDALIGFYPNRVLPEEIAAATVSQYTAGAGAFNNALGRLRSLEAAEGYGREGVKAADVFFD